MRIFRVALVVMSVFFIVSTLLPIIPLNSWWVQIFVFPRLQIVCILLFLALLWLIFFGFRQKLNLIVISLIGVSLVYQFYRIYPYTYLSPTQTKIADVSDSLSSISAVSANVFMKNREYRELIEVIRKKKPDLVLLLETDEWWAKHADTLLNWYPYSLSEPLDNTYGMMLYSKLKLEDAQVKYLIEDSIPSMHAYVRLRSGDRIKLYCLHPKPPVPPESESSVKRDAELLLAGKMVQQNKEPAIVMGDLNDVAWSKTTRLFLKTSQMLDPRIGRGFYNTFNAHIPLMRWSLDHVFHSESFQLNTLEVLPHVGSDHFPIYFSLSYLPQEKEEQEPLEPNTAKEEDTVDKTIKKGIQKEQKEEREEQKD